MGINDAELATQVNLMWSTIVTQFANYISINFVLIDMGSGFE